MPRNDSAAHRIEETGDGRWTVSDRDGHTLFCGGLRDCEDWLDLDEARSSDRASKSLPHALSRGIRERARVVSATMAVLTHPLRTFAIRAVSTAGLFRPRAHDGPSQPIHRNAARDGKR